MNKPIDRSDISDIILSEKTHFQEKTVLNFFIFSPDYNFALFNLRHCIEFLGFISKVHQFVSSFNCWFVSTTVHQFVSSSARQFTSPIVYQLVSSLVCQFISSSVCQFITLCCQSHSCTHSSSSSVQIFIDSTAAKLKFYFLASSVSSYQDNLLYWCLFCKVCFHKMKVKTKLVVTQKI